MNAGLVVRTTTGVVLLASLGCGASAPAAKRDRSDAGVDVASGPAPCAVGGTMAGLPVTVGCGQKSPARIVVSGQDVFWTNELPGMIVSRASTAGGPPAAIAFGDAPAFGLAVTDTAVYWTEPTAGRIMTVPRAGGPPTVVVSGLDGPLHLAGDGRRLYWTGGRRRDDGADGGSSDAGGFARGTISALALQPGARPVTLTIASRPYAIAVDDTAVYWTDLAEGTIMRLPTYADGEAPDPVVLAEAGLSPTDLAVAGDHVYWPDQSGAIWRVARAGGAPQMIAGGTGTPFAVAVDEKDVYWTSAPERAVKRAPIGGGAVTTVASEQDDPLFITLDATTVYWTLRGSGGRVAKAAK